MRVLSALMPPTLALLVLSACSQGTADPAPDPAPTTVPASPVPLAPIVTLEGEWRVAGIDGEALDEPYGIALSADGGEIWWEPRCANQARRYTIDGLKFASDAAPPSGPAGPGGLPPPICAIGLPPRVPDVMRALSQADTIGRTPENGVAISGPTHSVLLFRQ